MFLGIDIGTSGVKTRLVDKAGKITAQAYRPLAAYGAEEKKRELDPAEAGERMFETMEEVLGQCRDKKIDLITVAALGEAVIPLDRQGNVLARSIIGSDPRGAEEMEWMEHRVGGARLTAVTGLNLSYIYSLNKILYLRNAEADLHKKVWKYMCYTDYAGYLLTGEAKIDHAMASRTMAFDIHRMCWSKQILTAAGLEETLFSDPVPGGSIIGTLLPQVKKRLGISYEVPVMAGTHDHIFNAIGAGAVAPGICSNIVGTTEGITAVMGQMLEGGVISRENISCEPFVRPGLYNTVAWHNTAGAMVNWYTAAFWKDSVWAKSRILDYLTKTILPAPGSLMALPHFSGSTVRQMDEKAKGALIGLTTTTTREEIFQAILEGACYECRLIVETVRKAGIPMEQLIVSGGGSKSPLWLQLKADILGQPVYAASCADTGALGGAVLGAVVLGIYDSIEQAADAMLDPPKVIEPNMSYHRIYEERYEQYRELYGKLKDINHMLS